MSSRTWRDPKQATPRFGILAAIVRRSVPWRLTASIVSGLVIMQASMAFAAPAPFPDPTLTSSPAADEVVAWIATTSDNQGLPFLIVDKGHAQARVYGPDGKLLGAAPVLLGLAHGDVSPPGIGDRPLASIGPEDRVTPAGRFVASIGENIGGKSVLWINYEEALSLHPVVAGRVVDRRAERLASPTAQDNRISYGCVNVPADFYAEVVQPAFARTVGIVYILPERRTFADVFLSAPTVAAPVSANDDDPTPVQALRIE